MSPPDNTAGVSQLLDAPPLRARAYANKALADHSLLLERLGNNDSDLLLEDLASTDPDLKWVQKDWSSLARAFAADHYADAGFQAIAWAQGMLDAVQVLRGLLEEHADGANGVWKIHTPFATLDHRPSSGVLPQGNRGLPEDGPARVLCMDDVVRELDALSDESWRELTSQLKALMPAAGNDTLIVATGALGCLVVGGRTTYQQDLHFGGDPIDWHLHIQWLDSETGQGPSGERVG